MSQTPSDPFATIISAATAAEQQHQADQATIARQAAQIQQDAAQIAALQVQIAASSYPAWPAPLTFAPGKAYHVSVTGHDNPSADGSAAKPYATADYALKQIDADRAAGASGLAEIAYDGQGKNDWAETTQQLTVYPPVNGNGWFTQNNILFRSYDGIAKIVAVDVAFGHGAATQPHQFTGAYFSHLKIVQSGTSPNMKQGISLMSTDDVIVDHCWIEGFVFNVALTWQCTGWKMHHCFLLKAQPQKKPDGTPSESGSGFYCEGQSGGDFQANVLYRNGISTDASIYPGAGYVAQQFWHGAYINQASNAQPFVTNRFNFFGVNASTGFVGRPGGKMEYFVSQVNGTAQDVFENGNAGEIGNFALFGDTGTTDFWFAGGGALSRARAASIHDGVVLSASSQTKGAAVQIGAADTSYSTTSPVSAAVSNVRGIWQNNDQGPNDVSVDPSRQATIAGVAIRRPNAGEKVPSLLDYTGTTTDEAAWTAIGVGALTDDPKYSAQAILAWANQVCPS